MIKRYLKRLTGGAAAVEYHALYHMNVATEGQRRGFIAKVAKAMERF